MNAIVIIPLLLTGIARADDDSWDKTIELLQQMKQEPKLPEPPPADGGAATGDEGEEAAPEDGGAEEAPSDGGATDLAPPTQEDPQ